MYSVRVSTSLSQVQSPTHVLVGTSLQLGAVEKITRQATTTSAPIANQAIHAQVLTLLFCRRTSFNEYSLWISSQTPSTAAPEQLLVDKRWLNQILHDARLFVSSVLPTTLQEICVAKRIMEHPRRPTEFLSGVRGRGSLLHAVLMCICELRSRLNLHTPLHISTSTTTMSFGSSLPTRV